MSLSITEILLSNINTISIPTDAVLLISVLITSGLLIYVFNNIFENQMNQMNQMNQKNQMNDDDSKLKLEQEKLENQLATQVTKLEQKRLKKDKLTKLNFLEPSKLLGLVSFAGVVIGGTSLLGFQTTQKSYEGVNTSQINLMPKNQSTKSFVSMIQLKPLHEFQNKVQKINASKYNIPYNLKEKQKVKNFSF